MKQRIFNGLIAIMGIFVFSSCDCSYDEDNRIIPTPATPTPDPTPDPEAPMPINFSCRVSDGVEINDDYSVKEWIVGKYSNDSLVTRELRWNIAPRVTGPSYLVVMDSLPTVNCGADRPSTTKGNGQVTASGDSIRTDVTTSDYKFTYYKINITTENTVGYACFSGHWEPYLPVVITTSCPSFKSEWVGEIEREDSIFLRERTLQSFVVLARASRASKTFTLEKEVIIDHFLKMKEEVEEPTPEPQPETIKADVFTPGLVNYIAGNRVYNNITWNDAYLYECVDHYFIVVAKFQVITEKGDEVLIGYETQTVSKTVCPTTPQGGWKGIMYVDGKYYPANYLKDSSGWTWVTYVNGKRLTQTHEAANAVNQGIKNFTNDHTAEPTPIISVSTPDVQNVNGLKVITITGKTNVHTLTLKVADEGLKN